MPTSFGGYVVWLSLLIKCLSFVLVVYRHGEKVTSDGSLVLGFADDVKKLQASIDQLQTDYSSLLQQSSSCCRTQSQTAEQIRAGIHSYMNKVYTCENINFI